MIARRAVLAGLLAAALPGAAPALSVGEAQSVVLAAVEDVAGILSNPPGEAEDAALIRDMVEARTVPSVIARFVAGARWSGMTPDQQRRFTDALLSSVTSQMARQIADVRVAAEDVRRSVHITRTMDAGAKGVLVETEIRPPGAATVPMAFLVSDRPGRPVIVDITVANISLAVTQREIVQAMFEARDGDAERVIADLCDC